MVKEEIHRFALIADPGSEMEPVHLVRSRPMDRPADVLSTAPGRLSAMDVGITSSATASAVGEDAAEAMWARKTAEREGIRTELDEIGVTYTPIIWTNHGRAHPEADRVIQAIAKNAARRRGCTARAMERAIRGRICAAIARRGARMSLAASRHARSIDASQLDNSTGAGKELPEVGLAADALRAACLR